MDTLSCTFNESDCEVEYERTNDPLREDVTFHTYRILLFSCLILSHGRENCILNVSLSNLEHNSIAVAQRVRDIMDYAIKRLARGVEGLP
jgi:hypothetical protein